MCQNRIPGLLCLSGGQHPGAVAASIKHAMIRSIIGISPFKKICNLSLGLTSPSEKSYHLDK